MHLKSIGVASAAKMAGGLYAALGFIFGCLFALMSLVSQGMWADEPAFLGTVFGVGAIVFLPIFYGVIGILVGAIGAALYNWLAGRLGGFEIELE